MALIIDERQLKRLKESKRRSRRGRAVKPSAKTEIKMRRRMDDLWREVLGPTAEKIKLMVRNNASASEIANVIELALTKAEFDYGVQMDDIVTQWQMGVDSESSKAIRKGLSASLSVDISALVDEPAIKETIAIGSTEAAGLIKSIPGEYLGQIARAVTENFAGIPLTNDRSLLEQILEIGKVSRNRAQLIARDQTSKLTSAVNQQRQMDIGISIYIWRTSKDQRVVGNPAGLYPTGNKKHGDHFSMEGKYCRWDDNTVYSDDKGKTWKKRKAGMPKSIPGWDIQCRCVAIAVIDIDQILKHAQRL